MQLSIWTGAYADLPAADAVLKLRSLGWPAFDLCTEHVSAIAADRDPAARIEEFRAALAETASSCRQAHAKLDADVGHPDATRRAGDLSTVESHLRLCARMGLREVVVHPGCQQGYTSAAEFREQLRANVAAFRRLGELAGELGVRVCVENLFDAVSRGRRCFGAMIRDLLELFDAAKSPALAAVLDTSHANVQRLDIGAAIRELGGKLAATHISDNDGTGDQHRSPGHGRIDWRAVVAALRETGYAGTFNLEIPGERHPEPAIHDLRMRHARELAEAVLELQAPQGLDRRPAAG